MKSLRQEVVHVLYDYRVDELEDKIAGALDDVAKLLVSASRGVSKRFSCAGQRFRENSFNRLFALHIRRDEAANMGCRLIERIRSNWFDVKRIHELHTELDVDLEVDKFIRELGSINAEASTFLAPESDDEE